MYYICMELFGVLMLITDVPYLYEGAECAVCRVVRDKESHVLVAQFHWSRTVHDGL